MSHLHRVRHQLYNARVLQYLLDHRHEIDRSQLSHLLAIQQHSKGINQFEVSYQFKTNTPGKDCRVATLGFGRIYGPIGSAEYLDNSYRHNLYADTEHDIDIQNCHPSLLLQMANTLHIDMPHLSLYVQHRESYLRQAAEYYQRVEHKELSRSDLKTMIIATLYGAKGSIFDILRAELDHLTTALSLQDYYQPLFQAVSQYKAQNRNGTFLAFVAQTEERKCLEALDTFFFSLGRLVDALAYDGLMLRKLFKDELLPVELLRQAEHFVLQRTGYSIHLEIKPMIMTIDVSLLMTKDEKEDAAYRSMKSEFERSHFYFVESGTYCEVLDHKVLHYQTKHALTYFNTWILASDSKGRSTPFFPRWIQDPTRRMIRRFVYKLPAECSSDEFPLFLGFDFQHLDADPSPDQSLRAVSHFQDLLLAVCDDDQKVADHVLHGFAHLVQRPFEKTGIITAFASPYEGTGKDTLMGIIARVVGPAFTAHYTSTDQFWDRHDDLSVGKGFVYLEEACSSLNKAKQGELKARATADTLSINPKGIRGFSCPNIGRIYMTTNEIEPFKVSPSDRRGFIISPGTRLVHSDWTPIQLMVRQPWYTVAIGRFLLSVDISLWIPTQFPETAVKAAMKELAVSSEELFLRQWSSPEYVHISTLYEQYVTFCVSHHFSHAQNAKSFGIKLIHHQKYFEKIHRNDGSHYKSTSNNK